MKKIESPRVFSIGYANLAPADLKALVDSLDVILLDVRSRPSGRVKRGFSRADLESLLGTKYEWHPELGGRGTGPTVDGLKKLVADKRRILCMCQEETPMECHRHRIAMHLAGEGVTVHHIYQTEVMTAVELQRAVDQDDEYEFVSIGDVIDGVK